MPALSLLPDRPTLSLTPLSVGAPMLRESIRHVEGFDSQEEESAALGLLAGPVTAIGYLGTSVFDAILGRRVRAGVKISQGRGNWNTISELFSVPILSDMFGWTDPKNVVTGKDLIGWDDEQSYLDDVAGIAVEVLTDPLTYFTGGVTGLLGTTAKAGKIIAKAGLIDDMARAASVSAGRKIGRREFMAMTALKDVPIPKSGIKVIDEGVKKRLDNAAAEYGFKNFDEATQSGLGSSKLSAAWGFTPIPMSSTPMSVIEGGDKFIAVQRKLDQADQFIKSLPPVRMLRNRFSKAVNNAETAAGQEQQVVAGEISKRAKYERSKHTAQTLMRWKALGIDDPQFHDDLMAAVELQVVSKTPELATQMRLLPQDRDVDKVLGGIFGKSYGSGGSTKYGNFNAAQMKVIREEAGDYVKEKIADDFDRQQRAMRYNIGAPELNDVASNYGSRMSTKRLSLEEADFVYPKSVTDDMLRELGSPRVGMTRQAIAKQAEIELAEHGDLRGLFGKAYPGKLDEAKKRVLAQEANAKAMNKRRGVTPLDSEHMGSSTYESRVEPYRNIRSTNKYAGGTTTLNLIHNDTRIASPLATLDVGSAADTVFKEYMGGDIDTLRSYMGRLEQKDISVGSKYGGLAKSVGRKADDVIADDAELRVLKETMQVERQAYDRSVDIANLARERSPIDVLEQRPLFNDDVLSVALHRANGQEEFIQQAGATMRMLGDTATQNAEGVGVIDAMKHVGLGLGKMKLPKNGMPFRKQAKTLANYLEVAAEENGRRNWQVFGNDMDSDYMVDLLTSEPPPRMIRSNGKMVKNPARMQWDDDYSRVLIQFGLSRKIRSAGSGEEGIKKLVASMKREFIESNGGAMPTDAQLAEMVDAAKGATSADKGALTATRKMYDRNLESFRTNGMQAYRVPQTVIGDANRFTQAAMGPEVIQNAFEAWNKVSNPIKSAMTSQWIPFFSRNSLNLFAMDVLTNAKNVLDPREYYWAAKRFNNSRRFLSGESIKGIHKYPMFSDVKWGNIADHDKDRLATDMFRQEAFALGVGNSGNNVVADVAGAGIQHGFNVGDSLPGIGKNVRGFGNVMKTLREAFTGATEKGVDFKNLLRAYNPLDVRGGPFKSSKKARSNFVLARLGEDANGFAEDIGRTSTLLGQLEKGVDPLEAMAKTNAAHVDYSGLSSFEKKYMRAMIPFYTYNRKMIPHLLREMVKHPGGPMTQMVRTVNILNEERRGEKFTPQQLAGQLAIPIHTSEDGKVKAYIRPSLPIDTLNNLFSLGPDAYSTFQNTGLGWLSQMHMMPKGFLETAFGKSTFQRGRNLEDMYSRIGVKDPILNQIVMMSPAARYASVYGPGGILNDERKSITEKAMSQLLGMPIMTIDMDKAQNEAINKALNRALSLEEGIGRSERFYTYGEDETSDRAERLMKLKTSRDTRAMREAKTKEKRAALTKDSVPPDMLRRLGL